MGDGLPIKIATQEKNPALKPMTVCFAMPRRASLRNAMRSGAGGIAAFETIGDNFGERSIPGWSAKRKSAATRIGLNREDSALSFYPKSIPSIPFSHFSRTDPFTTLSQRPPTRLINDNQYSHEIIGSVKCNGWANRLPSQTTP